ncbi:MAG: glycosyltransferase [Magnetococcales bacterium]|nr:glycosyltransferase [Magnetococcales bacterium]
MANSGQRFPTPMRVEPSKRRLRIAVVSSRCPLPMDRADQMTVAYLIDFLHKRGHEVDLHAVRGSTPPTIEDQEWLESRCKNVSFYVFGKIRGIVSGVLGALRGLPMQVGLFNAKAQSKAVRKNALAGDYDIVYCYYFRSSAGIQDLDKAVRAAHPQQPFATVLAMQLSQTLNVQRMVKNIKNPLEKLVYAFESRLIGPYEAKIWQRFTRSVLIGPNDVKAVQQQCDRYGQPAIDNFVYGPHGVDIVQFTPQDEGLVEPNTLAFTGSLITNTNVHAIMWFCEHVWPVIKQQIPDVRLLIAGRNPRKSVQNLGRMDGITVLANVPSIADIIARAGVYINPIQVGAGLQNKLLEALAMGKAVVATPVANEGIRATPGEHLQIESDAQAFADSVVTLLKDDQKRRRLGEQARNFVVEKWSWEAHFLNLERDFIQAMESPDSRPEPDVSNL